MAGDISKDLLLEIHGVVAKLQDGPGESFADLGRREIEFQKWQLIHKWIHGRPFRTREHLPRSRQWREALDHVRDLRDQELIDWVLLQAEVAGNLERGIQDLRPRKNGPCHPLILEYVANRKRKALAVLHFARAAEEEGCYQVNSDFHARTATILNRHGLIERDEDGNPVYSMDPFSRN
ncbi:MAG: hypothetical protein KDJ16_14430 [Hyphomicrobiales bacterium]|nr:hypothetical protein [Hyphomicrobiales bacterium]